MPQRRVYFFGGGRADGRGEMKNLLGGKGANLAEMTNLGIPVPAGSSEPFQVTTSPAMDRHASWSADGQYLVFAEEAAEAYLRTRDARTGDGQHADEKRPAGERHLLGKPAHLPHVLLVVAALDDLSGTEEDKKKIMGAG